ncbi:MAG: hypothetical protein DHS20C02_14730 [Micavibrio sp.]|nr:MAG: hypothetical protein DHS20C02_14730 [Micavibrio sp.]
MIDITAAENQSSINPEAAQMRARKVLRMVHNERTAGSIPMWEKASTGKQTIEENLSRAATGDTRASFQNTLAYQDARGDASAVQNKEFGFGDLVDMVNPLHHIPVVGHLYRHFTGDEIRPISNIIGGAVYGGPIGAASGLINTISQEETGKDLAGNALAFVFDGETPRYKSEAHKPEAQLTASLQKIESGEITELPGSVLSFADLGGGRRMVSENMPVAGGRTAGTMVRKHIEMMQNIASAPPLDLIAPNVFPILEEDKKSLA